LRIVGFVDYFGVDSVAHLLSFHRSKQCFADCAYSVYQSSLIIERFV